ncbi:MAG: amino acid adenylation domain-containing protein [Acidobacteriota bacterium]
MNPLLSGGRCDLVSISPGPDMERLSELLPELTRLHAVPALMRQIVESVETPCPRMRTLFVGGEAVPADLLSRMREVFPGAELRVLYGPTEATIIATSWRAEPEGSRIGRPLPNVEIRVVDRDGHPAPIGASGEVWIGGPGVAHGYLRRPELTAERFVERDGRRFYRTGDLARWSASGDLEFLGRGDDQVKLRGFRIELGEIESLLREAEGVRDAAAGLVGNRLVAWVVLDRPGVDPRPFLQERLPSYMVPSAIVELESLPLTAHGKLDRRELPDPERVETGSFQAPRTETERLLAEVWAELLKLERVGVHDNFFELGGDSILSIQVVSRAARSGCRITPRQLFEHPTIAELASVAGTAEAVRAEQGVVTGPVPLTPIQRLFLERDPAEPHHFNQSLLLAVRPPVTEEVARQAFEALLGHHDALRLRFERSAEGWHQWNGGLEDPGWSRIELSSANEVQRSLNLSSGPIARGAWIDLPEGEARLLLVIHHLAVDGVSWRVLLEDLETACRQLLAGEPIRLPAKTTSYKKWAERLNGLTLESERPWWSRESGEPALALPVDFPGGENTGATMAGVSVSLDAEETRALLQEVPAAYRTRIDDVLLTALARVFAGDALRVELEGHGRELDGVDLSRTVGWFTSVYPVRLEVGTLRSVKEHLRSIPRRGIGWGLLRLSSSRPEIGFNYLGQLDQVLPEGSLFTIASEPGGSAVSPKVRREHLLDVNAVVAGGRLKVDWIYSTGLHRRETIETWAEHFLIHLRELIDHARSRTARRIGGYTPSDFPLAGLDQEGLDRLAGSEWGIEEVYPLSPLQEGMLFETLLAPGSGVYVEQLLCRIEGDLDEEVFERACRWTLESHGVLRTSFHWQELDRPLQVVHGRPEVVLERQDWRGLPAEGRLEELQHTDRQRGFDLSRSPLMRWTVVRTGEAESWLLWSQHHLLLDGWSLSAVIGSLLEAYRALRSGRDPRAERRRPYRDYIAWLESRDLAETESFWRRTLSGWSEPTPLPESQTRQTGRGRRELRLPVVESARFQAQARAHQLTPNTLVQAAWGLLLGRMAGVDDVVFGATVSGRPAELAGVETMVGLFINTLPVRLRLDSPALLPWLRELLGSQAELRQHEHSPLVKVQAWSEVPRGRSLFDSILVFENYPIDAAVREAGGGENGLGIVEVRSREQTNYPMTLDASPGAEMLLALNFDRSRFDEASVGRMLSHLESLLTAMAEALEAGGGTALSALPLLKDAERHQLLVDWNDTARDLPREPVHERFARQSARTPEAVALSFGDETLSYEALDRRSNRVAHALRRRGVAPGAIVGLSLERSLEMVVGLLGIWKAGGAYLPLDPAYPAERLSFLKEDAGVEVVLTREILAEEESDEALAVASDLAYVIYTSGSTGRPKGVLVGHAQLAHTLSASLSEMGWNESDRIACLAPFSFDIFLFELLSPLLSGGRCDLVSISPGPDMERLAELLPELTRLHAVPALMRQIVEMVQKPCPRMRTLFVGGEAVPADLLSRMREVFPGAELRVLYGPTEATIIATSWRAEPAGSRIGRPLPNVEIRVVDRNGQPVPIGASGEIWIGGPGVARGYLGRPELTAERFVERDGRRFYRTGDLARWSASGDLEFLGRGDDQVKLRGFRIELGEIESLLREVDGVRDAAAGLVGNRLVAWVVLDRPGVDPRPFLQERLPSYMVPSAIVELESLPLTAHGKLDRRALPDPERLGTGSFEAPRTETERLLAGIWTELLKLDQVGVHDNFFELGGDSILSIQVVSRAARSGCRITPRQLFEHPTIVELAAVAGTAEAVQAEQDVVTGPVPLTPIQRLFLEPDPAEPHHFNQSLLLAVRPPVTEEVARRAFEALLGHHDALRLRFERGADGWRQWNAGLEDPSWSRIELSSVNEIQRSLDLSSGPITRGAWIDLPEGETRLLLVIHHLAVDGVSWRVLLEDLEAACRQLLAGEPVRLPAKTTSYKEWAGRLKDLALESERPWWTRESGEPALALPVDFPSGENTGATAAGVSVSLDTDETRALLQEVPAAYRTRIDDVLLTALARCFRGDALRVELEGHGRELDGVDLSRTVGWFTSVYPVRLEVDTEDPGEALRSVKEHLRAIPRRGIGWGLLRLSSTRPEIGFNYLGQLDQALPEGSLFTIAPEPAGAAVSPKAQREHRLDVNAAVAGGRLRVDWIYSTALHRRETVEAWAGRFLVHLRELIDHARSRTARRIGGYTPSDFPLARLDQAALDRLVGSEWGIEEIHPLSPLQEGMLFETMFAPGSGVYVEQLLCRIEGDLDAEALERACRWTLESHGVLRTSFHWQELGRPLQVVHGEPEVVLERQDWRGLPPENVEDRLAELERADRLRGFDLSRAPLMRWTLVRTGEAEHWLLWSQHHLLLDGWSLSAVTGNLLEAYRALRSGREPRAERRRPHRDYIAWLESRDLSETESFWRRTLSGWSEPTPLPESPIRKTGRGRRELRLPVVESARFQAQARAHQLTLNTLVQAAWGLLLGRMAGTEDVVFGATVSGRPAELPGVETMVGLFINTLPVRLRLDSSALLPWLRELLSSQAELRQHEHSPLVKVQAWSEVPRGRALFESILVFENYPIDAAMRQGGGGENGLGIVEVRSREQTNYPMTLDVSPTAELMLALNFDRSRFDEASVGRMLGHLESLLTGMTRALEAGGDAALSALSLLNDAERHQLLVDWNDTACDLSREPVHERFARQAARTPEAVALSFGDETLSYEELDRRSNRAAHALRRRGVVPGAIVGLSLERSLEMVVGLLGIWKAGGAYLPLDPVYPPERLSFLKEDAGVEVVLTREILTEEESDEALAVPSDLAYVIYTSGSTGRPKGVLVGHAQLAHTLSASLSEMGWNGSDRIACLAPFSFDIFLFELLNPLLSGGRCDLVSISPGPDMERLSELLPELTRLHAVPALMRQIVEGVETPCPRMRTLFVGGEAVPADLLSRMREVFPGAELRVLYGPTEATIIATSWRAEPAGSRIGRPLPNVEIRVVDRDGHPAPIGASGEIWIGGPGVARGYLGRPELTAERFVERDGRRFYRTGDLARWNASGELEFLGRGDDQVKLRGFRIELGEIESLLREADGVRDAAAGLVGNRLVAWMVLDRLGVDPRPFLQERLPSYMVPSAIVELESLPLTAHGKLDRRALPDPERVGTGSFAAPRTETERLLAGIWAELLKLDRVGVHDNFFELGGDSILSIQVVSRAARSGCRITPRQLFEHPTIAELASVAGTAEAVQAEQGVVTGPVPLTPIQRLYLEPDPAEPHHFNQSLLLAVRSPVTEEVARQAFEALLGHHDALRLRFERGSEEWRQWNAGLEDPSWSRIELSAVDQIQRSLDLSSGPIARGAWIDLPEGEARLLLVIHHLAVDGVSWRVLLEDLETACRQLLAGEPVRLPAKTTSYKEWAERLSGLALDSERPWWTRESGEPALALPMDFPGGENTGATMAGVSVSLEAEETRSLLQEVPAAYRTRIDDVLLTALECCFVGEALRLELESHGREEIVGGVDLSRTVGWFTSVYPVRLEMETEDPGEALRSVKEHLRSIPRRGIGWGLLGLSSDRPEIGFNYLGQLDQVLPEGSLFTIAPEPGGAAVSPKTQREHRLDVNAVVVGGRLRVDWLYSTGLHRRETVEAWAERFLVRLRELIDHARTRAAKRIGGYTPSDFPLAGLEPAGLDRLVDSEWGIEEVYPLSPLQEGMLFETMLAPGSGVYVEQLLCRIEG